MKSFSFPASSIYENQTSVERWIPEGDLRCQRRHCVTEHFAAFCVVIALCLANSFNRVHAELVFYAGFDYDADSVIAGQGGWLTTGTSMRTSGSSLFFGDLVTTGGAAISSDPSSAETRRISIATGLATPTSGVRWISYLTQQTNGTVNFQGATFTTGNASSGVIQNRMIRVGTTVSGSGNPLNAGTGGSYGFFNAGITQQFNTGFTSNQPLFMAMKFDYDNPSITFYVNPTPGASEASLMSLGTLNAANNNLAPVHMNLGAIELEAANVYSGNVLFDEVRIGTTWASVSPTATAVPEPSSFALIAIGLGTTYFARRRKRESETSSETSSGTH